MSRIQRGSWISPTVVSPAPQLVLLFGLLFFTLGCTSKGGGPIAPPEVDPNAAADRALEEYDKDGDGALDTAELEACPGILVALRLFDTNNDQKVDRAELVTQIESLFSDGVGMTRLGCSVRSGSRPVAGAAVRFFPEKFLGEAVKPAGGWTDRDGSARIAIPDKFLPEDQHGLNMMQPGIYRVEIETSPGQTAKSKQPLGYTTDIKSRESTNPVFNVNK